MAKKAQSRSSKHQHPSTRENPITRLQFCDYWCLDFGNFLVLGCWCLDVFQMFGFWCLVFQPPAVMLAEWLVQSDLPVCSLSAQSDSRWPLASRNCPRQTIQHLWQRPHMPLNRRTRTPTGWRARNPRTCSSINTTRWIGMPGAKRRSPKRGGKINRSS